MEEKAMELEEKICTLESRLGEYAFKQMQIERQMATAKEDLHACRLKLAKIKIGRTDTRTIRKSTSGIEARLEGLRNEIISLKDKISKEKDGKKQQKLQEQLQLALTKYVVGKKLSEHFGGFSLDKPYPKPGKKAD